MLNAKWQDVNFAESTMKIPVTKNGEPRTIPLTPEAKNILRELSTFCNEMDDELVTFGTNLTAREFSRQQLKHLRSAGNGPWIEPGSKIFIFMI